MRGMYGIVRASCFYPFGILNVCIHIAFECFKQFGFPASADTRDDLYIRRTDCIDYFFQIVFSFYQFHKHTLL